MTRAGLWTTIVLAAVLTGTSAALTAQVHESVAARASQGAEAMQASRFDDAARIYAELVAVTPGDGGLQMNLGMARYMAGHPEEAVGPLRKAVQLGRFGERAVAHRQFNGHDRHRMIFEHDDFQPVGKNLSLNVRGRFGQSCFDRGRALRLPQA